VWGVFEWFAWTQVGVAAGAGLVAVVFAMMKRTPNDYTLGGLLLVLALLVTQVVMGIVQPTLGNSPSGSLLEWWMYVVTALLMLPAGIIWALVERSVMSNVVLGLLAGSVAVMLTRMHTIWFINSA
jgi:hypothetical protein